MKTSHFAVLVACVIGLLALDTACAIAPCYTATLLHPAGFERSTVSDNSGASIVGSSSGPATGGKQHALLWHGTAASVVDLNPEGFYSSSAYGVSGASQAGYGSGPATGGERHALHWNETAASVVDLHPDGFDDSEAWDISGASVVGRGSGPATGGSDMPCCGTARRKAWWI